VSAAAWVERGVRALEWAVDVACVCHSRVLLLRALLGQRTRTVVAAVELAAATVLLAVWMAH
jgi:hypothetical protein